MARSLKDLIQDEFSVLSEHRDNPEISSVGTTATRIFRRNPDRVALTIVNLSTVAMFTGHFPNPSSTNGYRLGPNGGSIHLRWDEDLHLPGEEWFIVADAASSNLYSVEYVVV